MLTRANQPVSKKKNSICVGSCFFALVLSETNYLRTTTGEYWELCGGRASHLSDPSSSRAALATGSPVRAQFTELWPGNANPIFIEPVIQESRCWLASHENVIFTAR